MLDPASGISDDSGDSFYLDEPRPISRATMQRWSSKTAPMRPTSRRLGTACWEPPDPLTHLDSLPNFPQPQITTTPLFISQVQDGTCPHAVMAVRGSGCVRAHGTRVNCRVRGRGPRGRTRVGAPPVWARNTKMVACGVSVGVGRRSRASLGIVQIIRVGLSGVWAWTQGACGCTSSRASLGIVQTIHIERGRAVDVDA